MNILYVLLIESLFEHFTSEVQRAWHAKDVCDILGENEVNVLDHSS